MQIKNKCYPYPVIAHGNDSYVGSSFDTDANYSVDAHNMVFSLTAELNDAGMQELIKAGKAKYAHHIECQATCFRKLVLTDEAKFDCSIHETLINGLVQICSFVVASEDIEKYSNVSFSRDYRGFKFDIDRGCVLAIGNQINITISKEKENISNTASIFAIRKNLDPTVSEMQVSTTDQKLVILLPEKTCNQYVNICNNALIIPVLHSMVVQPALMVVLYELREAAQRGELYNYENLRWYRSLCKTAGKLSIPFGEEQLKSLDVFTTVQKLLDGPTIKSMDILCGEDGDNND